MIVDNKLNFKTKKNKYSENLICKYFNADNNYNLSEHNDPNVSFLKLEMITKESSSMIEPDIKLPNLQIENNDMCSASNFNFNFNSKEN